MARRMRVVRITKKFVPFPIVLDAANTFQEVNKVSVMSCQPHTAAMSGRRARHSKKTCPHAREVPADVNPPRRTRAAAKGSLSLDGVYRRV